MVPVASGGLGDFVGSIAVGRTHYPIWEGGRTTRPRGGPRTHPRFPRGRGPDQPFVSCIRLAIRVTTRRGASRTLKARSLFLRPGITSGLPCSIAA